MQEFILASGSSRRQSLLNKLGLGYRVVIPDIDETPLHNECASEYVLRMAQSKARVVSAKAKVDGPVLAADTCISLDEKIIGKPENAQHAEQILQMLSGKKHQVLTGMCLITKKNEYTMLVKSDVKFKQLSNETIHAYCLTQEPHDKAGAYAIQGNAAKFIEYVAGSFSNVVGLPLREVFGLLKKANLTFSADV